MKGHKKGDGIDLGWVLRENSGSGVQRQPVKRAEYVQKRVLAPDISQKLPC